MQCAPFYLYEIESVISNHRIRQRLKEVFRTKNYRKSHTEMKHEQQRCNYYTNHSPKLICVCQRNYIGTNACTKQCYKLIYFNTRDEKIRKMENRTVGYEIVILSCCSLLKCKRNLINDKWRKKTSK